MNNINISKRTKIIIVALSILLALPFVLCLGLDTDEPYTIGLAHNSYLHIISLSKLDIHPPLYYLMLKAYIGLTNLISTNIFFTIIAIRLLSLLFTIITLVYLIKIVKEINIPINKYIAIIVFTFTPCVISFSELAMAIRMYSFVTMIYMMVLFYILKLYSTSELKYAFILVVIIPVTLYTHYFGGLFSGLTLIFFSIYKLSRKDYKYVLISAIIGLLSIITFIPWIPSLKHQLLLQSAASGSHNTMATIMPYIIIIGLVLVISFIFNAKYTNDISKIVFYTLFYLNAITLVIFVIQKINSPRYVQPILIPYLFIAIFISLNNIDKKKAFLVFISLFSLFGYVKSLHHFVVKFDIPSIRFVKQFEEIKRSPEKSINIHKYGLDKYYWDKKYGGGGGNAIYLESIGKKINDKDYINTYQILGNGNPKLFKAVFPNIEHFTDIQHSDQKNNKK